MTSITSVSNMIADVGGVRQCQAATALAAFGDIQNPFRSLILTDLLLL